MRHGTLGGYNNHKCRCDDCRLAKREDDRARSRSRVRRLDVVTDEARRNAMSDLLHELAPFGLTDDCPARKAAA